MVKIKFSFIVIYIILFGLQLFVNEKIFFTMFYGVTIIVVIELIYLILIYNYTKARFVDDEIVLKVKERKNVKILIHNRLSLPIFYLKLSYKINDQELESTIPDLFYRTNVNCYINMCFEKRGEYTLENFQMYFMDFLNIFTFRKMIHKNYKVKVYPVVNNLDLDVKYSSYAFSDENANAGNVEDVIQVKNIRKYFIGDPIKKIHWKLTAKHNEFLVKDYDNISGGNQLMVLNMNKNDYGLNKSENDEEMISFLCSVIRLYLLQGQGVDLYIFSNDIDNFQIRNNNDYTMLLEYFLKKSIKNGMDFVDSIIMDAAYYKKYNEALLFTPIITREFILRLDDLNKIGMTKYSIFHIGKSSADSIESLKALQVKDFAYNDITL